MSGHDVSGIQKRSRTWSGPSAPGVGDVDQVSAWTRKSGRVPRRVGPATKEEICFPPRRKSYSSKSRQNPAPRPPRITFRKQSICTFVSLYYIILVILSSESKSSFGRRGGIESLGRGRAKSSTVWFGAVWNNNSTHTNQTHPTNRLIRLALLS
jgi:hypothetical protein